MTSELGLLFSIIYVCVYWSIFPFLLNLLLYSFIFTILNRTYLSPKSTGWTGSLVSDKESGLQHLSNSEYLETNACVTTSDTTVIPVVPKHAMQAFMFLNQSAAAQVLLILSPFTFM